MIINSFPRLRDIGIKQVRLRIDDTRCEGAEQSIGIRMEIFLVKIGIKIA